jgi:hypothetical protein
MHIKYLALLLVFGALMTGCERPHGTRLTLLLIDDEDGRPVPGAKVNAEFRRDGNESCSGSSLWRREVFTNESGLADLGEDAITSLHCLIVDVTWRISGKDVEERFVFRFEDVEFLPQLRRWQVTAAVVHPQS